MSNRILASFPILLPSLADQRQIAEILKSLDQSIQATARKVAKLEFLRDGLEQFLMSKMADVPRVPMEQVAQIDRGKFSARPRNDPAYYGGNYPFIQTGEVAKAGRRIGVGYSRTLNDRGRQVSRAFEAGVIAVTIAANIADTAILDRPMWFPDSIVGVRAHHPHSPRWLEMCIHAAKSTLDARAPQSAQKNIKLPDLRLLQVPIPPPDEQAQLADAWEAATRTIDAETKVLAKLIGLHEGLSFDLLSGRVRVSAS